MKLYYSIFYASHRVRNEISVILASNLLPDCDKLDKLSHFFLKNRPEKCPIEEACYKFVSTFFFELPFLT